MVIVNPEYYVLVINISGKKIDNETIKKATEINPLLESSCKSKSSNSCQLNCKIMLM